MFELEEWAISHEQLTTERLTERFTALETHREEVEQKLAHHLPVVKARSLAQADLIADAVRDRAPFICIAPEPRRMKLFVQVPCLNEEETLPLVLETIPTQIPGIDEIVILVIDDGSTDRTVEVAKAHGVTHFVRHARNLGLGPLVPRRRGLRALELGADIVVNTDGDNQYPQERIADLVQPIIAGDADIVIADRQIHRSSTSPGSRRCCRSSAAGRQQGRRAPTCPTPPAGSAPTRATR